MTKREAKEGILMLIQRHGRFPRIAEMAELFELKPYQVPKLLQKLVEDGFLSRRGNWYQLAPKPKPAPGAHLVEGVIGGTSPSAVPFLPNAAIQEEVPPMEETAPPPIVEETPPEPAAPILTAPPIPPTGFMEQLAALRARIQPEKITRWIPSMEEDTDAARIVVQVGMGIIGTGAVIISMYYTSIWLLEFLPWVFAFILAAIMVGFSVLAFEAVILFLSGRATSHWTRWAVATSFVLLWIIVTVFSITSTIAGQYNRHVHNQDQQTREGRRERAAQVRWASLQERKQELAQRSAEKRAQIAQLSRISSGVVDLQTRAAHGGTFADTQWRIQKAEKELDGLSGDLEKIRAEESALLKDHPDANAKTSAGGSLPDFYTWVAGVLKASRDHVQFWMSLFPAVFVDVIAPTAIAVALFLRKRKPRSEEAAMKQ